MAFDMGKRVVHSSVNEPRLTVDEAGTLAFYKMENGLCATPTLPSRVALPWRKKGD